MYRSFYGISIVLFLLFTNSCKKDVLHWQSVQKLNSNTTSRLNKIRFLNDSICIIAGGEKWNKSDILRSADAGYTWTNSSSNEAKKGMYGMSVSPAGTIYLSGADGDVLLSRDLGKTWQFRRVNDWLIYQGISFPTEDSGILLNTTVQEFGTMTMVDSNFTIIDKTEYKFGLNDIYTVDAATSYIIGYGVVMKTSDHRRTWQFQDAIGDNFLSMDIHGNEIWMCGFGGSIYHTANGGDHWERLRNGNDLSLPRYHLSSIAFKDGRYGWAVGEEGVVLHTDDAGRHWAEYDRFTSSSLRSIAICPNGDLLIAGDNGTLYRVLPK
jgi:photosystem II stability/assembly factor-like uncharacterized protein